MPSFYQPSKIVITCNRRLTSFLHQEVSALGFRVTETFSTGVSLAGTLYDCIVLNLHLRCASQVLYSVAHFECDGPAQLYEAGLRLKWELIIPGDGYFSVTSTVDHPSINNSLFANVKLKDAIVDRFREVADRRPDSGPELQHTVLHLYWKANYAEIFIDTSGETLAKHGYRKIPGKAPMLEALVSAALLATRWDRRSAFVNPMCGSATIAIEAAHLATDRLPGLFRTNYGFQHILGFEELFYEDQKRRLAAAVREVPGLQIIASDISADAMHISKINAAAAGVDHLITFEQCAFEQTKIPENCPGVIFFNPEYGERLGDETELTSTYAAIGDFMKKKCGGYTGYIFTGNLELAKKIGLKAKRRIEFYTGKIDCRLLEYELYAGTRKPEAGAA